MRIFWWGWSIFWWLKPIHVHMACFCTVYIKQSKAISLFKYNHLISFSPFYWHVCLNQTEDMIEIHYALAAPRHLILVGFSLVIYRVCLCIIWDTAIFYFFIFFHVCIKQANFNDSVIAWKSSLCYQYVWNTVRSVRFLFHAIGSVSR